LTSSLDEYIITVLLNKQEQKLATKAPAKKTRVTKAQVTAHRTKTAKDYSPTWDAVEQMNGAQFLRHWHSAMAYYRMEFSGKDLKPAVIKWMTSVDCAKEDIAAFKKTKDNRCNLTMGSIASCLLRGMPAVRADFNDGRNTAEWLRNAINDVIAEGKDDVDEDAVATGGSKDEQLREAYSHRSRKQIKNLIAFYQEISSACDMLAQEAKVNRAPRKAKAVSKDKLVAKLKFMKSNEPLKLVSVNPADIIGAGELWIYNTKSRKLGKYVAAEFNTLGVKGTTITGFDEFKSICKTLRKPEEKLKEFKAAGKIALRKFLDDINATDTKMNGRINEEIILLKVA